MGSARLFRWIFSIFFMVIAHRIALAATPDYNPAVHYLEEPFDISLSQLPPNFMGHNAKLLFDKLELRSHELKRGEFETLDAYNSRKAKVKASPILINLYIDSLYAFGLQLHTESYQSLHHSYDIDRSMMCVSMEIGHSKTHREIKDLGAFLWSSKQTDERSYMAANAFGVTREVEKALVDRTIIGFPYSSKILKYYGSGKLLKCDIKMECGEGQASNGHIYALIIGRLIPPYTYLLADTRKPTLDDPRDVTWRDAVIKLEIVSVWFYNQETGKIYKKLR